MKSFVLQDTFWNHVFPLIPENLTNKNHEPSKIRENTSNYVFVWRPFCVEVNKFQFEFHSVIYFILDRHKPELNTLGSFYYRLPNTKCNNSEESFGKWKWTDSSWVFIYFMHRAQVPMLCVPKCRNSKHTTHSPKHYKTGISLKESH